jgi:hypothetical protein
MNQDKYIFSQLTEFMDNNKFYRIVKNMMEIKAVGVLRVGINC